MKHKHIGEVLKYNEHESSLFLPNEIFNELKEHISKPSHIAFAYSYIYFITWLYRYCKNIVTGEVIDNAKIKEILGYDPKNRTLNYLIVKNGLLDELGYTATTRDYPFSWSLDDGVLTFTMQNEINEEFIEHLPKINNRFFLKYPIKAMENRISKMKDENGETQEYEIDGTFFDVSNTHNISFEAFMFCMSNKEVKTKEKNEFERIGCTGFYIYCYLKHKCDFHNGSYDVSIAKLSEEVGIPERTLLTYLDLLKSYNMIKFYHNMDFFVMDIPKEERKANTYTVENYISFTSKRIDYKRMKFKPLKYYKDMKESQDWIDKEMPF